MVMIDADLRRPRIHRIFSEAVTSGNGKGQGLSSYLAGIVDEEPVIPTEISNLFIIPAGPIPPNRWSFWPPIVSEAHGKFG